MKVSVPESVAASYKAARLPHRKTMLEMRRRILEIVPEAEEVKSYGMPAFKVNGHVVAGLLECKEHVGYYPFSGSVLSKFKDELAGYRTTKSAIHLPVDKPLSKTLLKKLIKARISLCPVLRGDVNLSKYEGRDLFWRDLGLAAPARRALVDAKIFNCLELRRFREKDIRNLHGIGDNAMKSLRREMKRQGVNFKKY